MQKLLSMYQLWLDDLYPRAKFADGLAMIEKLGHTKRMQMMRKEWIGEGKPKAPVADRENDQQQEDDSRPTAPETSASTSNGNKQTLQPEEPARPSAAEDGAGGSGDSPAGSKEVSGNPSGPAEESEEDELDALLAESTSKDSGTTHHNSLFGEGAVSAGAKQANGQDDEFADEMDAMAEMDGMW